MFGALAALPGLTGCPGSLEGEFPPVVNNGSGGNSSSSGGSGSGGTTGSGGSGSGGSTASGGSTGTGGSTSTVCDAPNTVIKTNCATSNCHGGSQAPDLTASGLAARLIGVPALIPCGSESNIVDKTKPATGTLLLRIAGPTCVEQMPLPPASPLSAADQKCIVDWLNSQLQ